MLILKKLCAILATFLLLALTQVSVADDLAKQSQNPLGTIISFPLENNFYTGVGPSDTSAYVFNLKLVYPMKVGNWYFVNRFILPAIYSEGQDVPVPPGIEVDTGYSVESNWFRVVLLG